MGFSFEQLASPVYFAEHRMPPYSDHHWYPDLASAEASVNPLKLSLNGQWSFFYAKNEQQVPQGFEQPDYPVDSWRGIQVPGHIQLQGYDIPQYVNKQYPWEGRQNLQYGELPVEFNPVACYVRFFTLPEQMLGKRLFLSLQGAESCAAIWLNGSYAGFSSNSFSPCEFELTDYLQPGENRLAIRVYKWNCGSWLEDQDFYRFSGLYRDVYLYAVPEIHLQDLKLTAQPDASLENGLLTVTGAMLEQSIPCTAELLLEGQPAGTAEITAGSFYTELTVPAVRLWSAEKPELYTLELRLRDTDGVIREVICQRVGFRRFELKDGLMQLNGKRIVFKGVNRHDFSPVSGRAVPAEEIRRDLLTMKRNNINALRCCHYPNPTVLYELCDELGLYVIAENNLETHGTWDSAPDPVASALPGDRQEWKPMLADRITCMVEQQKNHPSILIWSVGNESFGGSVIRDLAAQLREMDSLRLVHYEGITHDRRYSAESTDMESRMYSFASEIRDYLKEHRERPAISCEFAHAMGNSCGGLDRYIRLTEEEPLYQGGFIWDFIDQAIAGLDRYGNPAMYYGGDLGDRPHDSNFSGNGICYADGRETPKMAEVKACYQDFQIAVTRDTISITNRSLFTNTNEQDCRVALHRNGELLIEAALETAVPPLQQAEYPNPFAASLRAAREGEYTVTVTFRQREETPWAPAGYETCFGQSVFCVEAQTMPTTEKASGKPLQIIETNFNIGVKGEGFSLLFAQNWAGLVSFRVGGRELLKQIPRPNFWRPVTDNDIGGGVHLRCAQWRTASEYAGPRVPGTGLWERSAYPQLEKHSDGSVTVTYTCHLATVPASSCSLAYTVQPDGWVECCLCMMPEQLRGLPPMPEYGMLFRMDASYDRLTWYGEGPEESYIDRRSGVRLGIYKSTPKEQFAPYLRPQECGNHTGVRWARVTDADGIGLEFAAPAGKPMEFSALPWTPAQLETAGHPFELPPVHDTVIRLKLRQMGVGGDDAWGSVPHPEYWLPEGDAINEPLCFSFRFRSRGGASSEE